MSTIAVTNPQRISIDNRRAKIKARVTKEEKARRKKWCEGKKCSCGCERDANTPHHTDLTVYENEEVYLDLSLCEPYYHRCHHALHKHFVKCPRCGIGWVREGAEHCRHCRTEEEKEQSMIRKETMNRRKRMLTKRQPAYQRFPCGHREAEQACAVKAGRCDRNRQTAAGCGSFLRRASA